MGTLIREGLYLTRDTTHPWDGRPGFDWLEIHVDTKAECDAVTQAAESKFWQRWLIGATEDGHFGGLMYKPSGISTPWTDTPDKPHPGIVAEQASIANLRAT